MLEELLRVVRSLTNESCSVEEVLQKDALKIFRTSEMIDKTDQEISEFINKNETDQEKRKLLFEIFQKLKLEQSLEVIQDEVELEKKEQTEKTIYSLFGTLIEPDSVEIKGNEAYVKYNISEESA